MIHHVQRNMHGTAHRGRVRRGLVASRTLLPRTDLASSLAGDGPIHVESLSSPEPGHEWILTGTKVPAS